MKQVSLVGYCISVLNDFHGPNNLLPPPPPPKDFLGCKTDARSASCYLKGSMLINRNYMKEKINLQQLHLVWQSYCSISLL